MKLPALWWSWVGKVPEISAQEFHAWLEGSRQVQVVDARTALEYQQGTIANAQHAPVTEMPGIMEHVRLDPQRPVVMLCLTGHRSRPGTRWLRAHGYEAYSLKGGVTAWKRAGYQVEKSGR